MMNIMNPPADWSTMKKLIWLRGTPITGGEELTVSGTPPLSLPNSIGKPLKAWEVDVVPYQEGTGDPSPSNVRTIHGTDKIGLYVGSPNVWDEEWVFQSGRIATKNLIPALPNTEYAWVAPVQPANGLRFYDSNQTLISTIYSVANNKFTTPPNCRYIWFALSSTYGTTYNNDIAINLPSSIMDYNSHQGGITSITLPQTVYTGTIGSDGGESRWGEVDLGTLTWMYFGIEGHRRFAATLYAKPNTINLLCTCYKAVAYSDVFNNTAVGIAIHTDGTQVVIYDPSYTDADVFKDAMSGVYAVYELANPTTFAVPAPTIPTPTGTATTWATAEDGTVDGMEVTYVGKA